VDAADPVMMTTPDAPTSHFEVHVRWPGERAMARGLPRWVENEGAPPCSTVVFSGGRAPAKGAIRRLS